MLNRTRIALIAALAGTASITALAADPASDQARRERMDQAYEDYRNPQPGPAARAESSIKRGAHKAGEAIKHGVQKTGEVIGKGVRKTGEAVGRGGEKLEDASKPKP